MIMPFIGVEFRENWFSERHTSGRNLNFVRTFYICGPIWIQFDK